MMFNFNETDATIDWGDNTTDTYTTAKSQPTHVYAKSGDYEIKIKGRQINLPFFY